MHKYYTALVRVPKKLQPPTQNAATHATILQTKKPPKIESGHVNPNSLNTFQPQSPNIENINHVIMTCYV